MASTLAYWDLRGLVQSIRLMLEYTETKYEDRTYEWGPVPHRISQSQWKADKYNLGLDFPNLPYYIDGDVRISQSNAILYYIAEKNDMCGQTLKDRTDINILVGVAGDMRRKWSVYTYIEYGTEDAKKEYEELLKENLKLLSNFLGTKTWFIGEKMTVPDFLLYELIDINLHLDSSLLDDLKNLKDFQERFEAIPSIKRHLSTEKYRKAPLNGPFAKIGHE